MKPLAMVAALCVCAIAVAMVWTDVPLALWIDAHRVEGLTTVGQWLDEAGKSHWVLSYCVLAIIATWRSMKVHAWNHAYVFGSVAISGIIANVIKVVACRPRPPLLLSQGITTWDWFAFRTEFLWNSFPSGHATTGIAIAISASAAWPRFRTLFWTIGILISLGRIVLDVHYLSDVLAGALLGGLVATTIQPAIVRRTKRNAAQ